MKILAIVLMLAGIGGIISGDVLPGILLLVIGLLLFKKKKNNKKAITVKTHIKSNDNAYTFRVAGVTKEGRQGTIKQIVKDWKECNPDDVYEGMSNKEIKEDDIEVYEADIENWCDIELVPEPDNQYDSNAIKVISDFGMLGYVPASETSKVKEIMTKDYSLSWRLIGGKYKYYDDYEDKVKIETLTYGIEINLKY